MACCFPLHCCLLLGFVSFWVKFSNSILVACSYLNSLGPAVIGVTLGAAPLLCGAQLSPCQAPVGPTDCFNLCLAAEAWPFPLPAQEEAKHQSMGGTCWLRLCPLT